MEVLYNAFKELIKMALLNVIKCEAPPSVLAWRHPQNAILYGSQLIVSETQHAVLMKEGRMIGPFGPGTHFLDTKNIAILKTFIGLVTGGASPFSAEVWFVNRNIDLSLRWQTAEPIQVKDPTYNIMIPITSYGSFGVVVVETKKFLMKLVGALPDFSRERVEIYFRGMLITSIKSHITKALLEKKISILEISAHLKDLSGALEIELQKELLEFGLRLKLFQIESITTDANDQAVKTLSEALAQKASMKILGTDYTQFQSFDVMKRAASNEGGAVGPLLGAGLGLGMGATIGAQAGSVSSPFNTQRGVPCSKCGTVNSAQAKFCLDCGTNFHAVKSVGSCPGCSQPLASGARFCPNCGATTIMRCKKCGTDTSVLDPSGTKFCGACGDSLNT